MFTINFFSGFSTAPAGFTVYPPKHCVCISMDFLYKKTLNFVGVPLLYNTVCSGAPFYRQKGATKFGTVNHKITKVTKSCVTLYVDGYVWYLPGPKSGLK